MDGERCFQCSGGIATCTQRAVCKTCGNEYGELVNHTGGIATCIQPAVCITCGNEYGELGSHSMSNGYCTTCNENISEVVVESQHSPYANSQNYVVLGTWDYSNAQSVTITITYQTESTSYDWISFTEGTDYVANSSYSATRNYLNTNGEIVSTTGTTSSVKFGGSTKQTKTFTVEMLTGSVIFRTDSSSNNYYGAQIIITPNY